MECQEREECSLVEAEAERIPAAEQKLPELITVGVGFFCQRVLLLERMRMMIII